eukprot:415209-Pelagomonas_calceolata.AAC.1
MSAPQGSHFRQARYSCPGRGLPQHTAVHLISTRREAFEVGPPRQQQGHALMLAQNKAATHSSSGPCQHDDTT